MTDANRLVVTGEAYRHPAGMLSTRIPKQDLAARQDEGIGGAKTARERLLLSAGERTDENWRSQAGTLAHFLPP